MLLNGWHVRSERHRSTTDMFTCVEIRVMISQPLRENFTTCPFWGPQQQTNWLTHRTSNNIKQMCRKAKKWRPPRSVSARVNVGNQSNSMGSVLVETNPTSEFCQNASQKKRYDFTKTFLGKEVIGMTNRTSI